MSTSRPCFGEGLQREEIIRHYLRSPSCTTLYIESLTYTEKTSAMPVDVQDTTEFDTVTYYSYAVTAPIL